MNYFFFSVVLGFAPLPCLLFLRTRLRKSTKCPTNSFPGYGRDSDQPNRLAPLSSVFHFSKVNTFVIYEKPSALYTLYDPNWSFELF